jgi:hypothetical protein
MTTRFADEPREGTRRARSADRARPQTSGGIEIRLSRELLDPDEPSGDAAALRLPCIPILLLGVRWIKIFLDRDAFVPQFPVGSDLLCQTT